MRTIVVATYSPEEGCQLGWCKAVNVFVADGCNLEPLVPPLLLQNEQSAHDILRDASQQRIKQFGGFLVGQKEVAIVRFWIDWLGHGWSSHALQSYSIALRRKFSANITDGLCS